MQDNLYFFLTILWKIVVSSFRSAYSISSLYLLKFLKSSSSSVLLPISVTSVIRPSMKLWRKQFRVRICPFQLAFVRRILFRRVLFSNHQRAVFFFLLLSLPPFVLQCYYEFLLKICPIQLTFLRTIFLRRVLFSPIRIRLRMSLLVTFSDHFIFPILLQHQISKLFKYLRSNVLSFQVSEPYNSML